jgi:carboxyl-terminal processing protease
MGRFSGGTLNRRRLLLGIAFVVLFGLGWWVGRGGAAGDMYGNLDLFVEVLSRVEESYVDPVDSHQLVDGALRGMLKELDPYSQYLDEKSFTQLRTITHGEFGGIGIVVSIRNRYPTVISPIEGTPAWEAGLSSGDIISQIDGKSSYDITVEDAADLLRGAPGTTVAVTVRREGQPNERTVPLERRVIKTKAVPYAFVTDDRVGYLRLASFSESTGEETRAAIAQLKRDGARSLVLDLRMNPGGLLDQAVDVAEQFLPKGSMVVYTDGRIRQQDHQYFASERTPETRWPMVVLIDGGSASASEIVAGAIQDTDRGLLVGRTSFGKGSVQSVFPLAGEKAALKLTTALYYTPSGRSIHRKDRENDEEAFLDEDEGVAPPAPHAAPGEARPEYRTAGGRTVYGGGGIAPDIDVRQDSLPPIVIQVEQLGLPFRFANRWVNTHEVPVTGRTVPEKQWRDFLSFMQSEADSLDVKALQAERPVLERALRRELARRLGGDAAAARVVLEEDSVFQRAHRILSVARRAEDVFAGVSGDADAPLRRAANE